ncbi:type I-C CRISPR-associated protein Cas8c/Csd1 [Oleiagrimonas sp. C23AA]|uniref:type I-C CRISPR-associated protein Cas8c/Csd1 n=1 Tax=Oleiagrimonas sp. C23AA TaxID=2719047 RepID=UPI00141DC435|nr:type I-C CRISPR-associated protein Cas8c/Csd1 [Oleiagrimonas sp. C23AA]NII11265.1 type I-C CRISPR-associated protein Cas8c/Csd1 [Oleiagrimonas sp. C23AA]
MILTALYEYYQRLLDTPDTDIPRPGYSREKIGYAIELDAQGHVTDVIDLHHQSGKNPQPRQLSVPQPEKRTVAVKPNFLWDKTSYVLGVSASSKRCAQEHEAFKRMHQHTLATSDDAGLKALLAFLERWTPQQFEENPHFVEQGENMLDANLVFRLAGESRFLHDRPTARALWSQQQAASTDSPAGLCLVTGEQAPLARLHPAIKGVNGAQSSGASIVSFNLDAFTSYGKQQGENAPVSVQAAFAYTTVLNHLLRREASNQQRMQIGDTTVVFWAQAAKPAEAEAAEAVLAALFGTGETDEQATQRLHQVLQQVRQMRPLKELGEHLRDGTRIFVLGLAPNASRLSIRFWETGSLAMFAKRLADHYQDLALVPTAWRREPTPRYLALQTAPQYAGKPKEEDVSPLLAGELARAILTGSRYPRSVLAAIVMRFRADGNISPLRVALCKGVLARNARLGKEQGKSTDKGEPPMSLDTNNTEPGYLLGRLFSTLENVQRAALGSQINATIRDRYYGAASATPASIFPVLLRNTQSHLSKLRKDKAGLAVKLEKELGQIIDLLGPHFPRSLGIEAQGQFAIGYYHQTQARFARNEEQDATESEGEIA